jgi:adenylosuccinate lyase
MEERGIFKNLSPLDHRYSISEQAVFDSLVPWLSEEASVAACVKAEDCLLLCFFCGKVNYGTGDIIYSICL